MAGRSAPAKAVRRRGYSVGSAHTAEAIHLRGSQPNYRRFSALVGTKKNSDLSFFKHLTAETFRQRVNMGYCSAVQLDKRRAAVGLAGKGFVCLVFTKIQKIQKHGERIAECQVTQGVELGDINLLKPAAIGVQGYGSLHLLDK